MCSYLTGAGAQAAPSRPRLSTLRSLEKSGVGKARRTSRVIRASSAGDGGQFWFVVWATSWHADCASNIRERCIIRLRLKLRQDRCDELRLKSRADREKGFQFSNQSLLFTVAAVWVLDRIFFTMRLLSGFLVLATISLATADSVPLSPTALVVSPEGKMLYVACATANRVLCFDTAERKVTGFFSLPESPSGLVLSSDGTKLFVTCAAP